MTSKVKQELLLTKKQRRKYVLFKFADDPIYDVDALLKAQLAKAEQYYESQGIYLGTAILEEAKKQERERIGQLLTNIGYYEKVTDFIAEIQGQEEDERRIWKP